VVDDPASGDGPRHQRLLWGGALALYGVGDTATTVWGVSTGAAVEAGVVAGPMMAAYGTVGLLAVKLVVFAAFYGAWRLLRGPGRTAVPAALVVVGGTVSLWNVAVLAGIA